MAFDQQQKEQFASEIFDSKRIQIKCGEHLYFGPVKGQPEIQPQIGCPNCWKVFFIHELATTPADERGKKLEEIEEVVHNAVQLVESGKWDIAIYPHAQIEIGKE